MVNLFFAFIISLVLFNLAEWVTHKYILHGLGKKKKSWFHYHWQHHHTCRTNKFIDNDYVLGFFKSSAYRREVFSIMFGLLLTSWTYFIWPTMFLFFILFAVIYFLCHSYSHINVNWGKKWLKWHYDHHMGRDQDKNWCVTFPLWDYILGSREKM